MNRLARTPLAILLPVLWTAALPAHAQTLSPQEVFRRVSGSVVVIEVNDNPSIDADVEDAYLGDDLYRRIMSEFLRRMERKRLGVHG